MHRGSSALDGWSVVDLSVGIASGYCSKILSDAGAQVILVEVPTGSPLRRWSASRAPIAPGDDGALFQHLCESKSSVVVDPREPSDVELLAALIRAADVVVWSPGNAIADDPRFSPDELRTLAPAAAVVALTPFGLTGPWVGRPATEFTLQAWSGGMGQRGSPSHPPMSVGGSTGDWVTGLLAAVAALASRHRGLTTHTGELLDVSMLEALALTHTFYPVSFHTTAGFPWRKNRFTNLPGIHPSRDGHVGFMVVSGQQWLDFCVLVEQPAWLDDQSLLRFENRSARADELVACIDRWTAERSTTEVTEQAALLRVPAAAVGNGANVVEFDHLVEGGFFRKNARGGFLQPGVPYSFSAGPGQRESNPAPRLGEHTGTVRAISRPPAVPAPGPGKQLPLEGVRVADMTAYWAGPFAGAILAMLGADVIHVESADRPDGMRLNSFRPLEEDLWWECSPLFHATNTNKRGLTLDLETDRGRDLARRLIQRCDVVLENFSPRVMDGWGLTYEQLALAHPDLIMVRMPAFGLRGPWRDRGGYAATMEQISGLAWITGDPAREPEVPNGLADPVGGAHAAVALLIALEQRRRTGLGTLVEVPMVGGALAIAAEQIVEHSAYGGLLNRQGNASGAAAPQGVYLCADVDGDGQRDRWVALAVADDGQWAGLRAALRDPGWARSADLTSPAGRTASAGLIDRELSAWCSIRSCDRVVDELWASGVPVARVILPYEQPELDQLRARGFFEEVEHPATGGSLQSGYPVRFSSGPERMNRRHAPLLGEHNHEILAELLELSESEIAQLEADRIIGTRPLSTESVLKGFR